MESQDGLHQRDREMEWEVKGEGGGGEGEEKEGKGERGSRKVRQSRVMSCVGVIKGDTKLLNLSIGRDANNTQRNLGVRGGISRESQICSEWFDCSHPCKAVFQSWLPQRVTWFRGRFRANLRVHS